ncbi:MAG: MerR family transcriptional regulator [Myxococcota bacterium]
MTAPRQTGAVSPGGVAVASDPGWEESARAQAGAESGGTAGPTAARRSRPPSQVPGAVEVPVKSAAQLPDRRYFRIGEVATLLGVKPYVLRYWETEFPQVRPQKSRSGQRLYRRREVEQLIDIRHLLYERGFTIAGARKVLKEQEDTRGTGRQTSLPPTSPPTAAESVVPLAPDAPSVVPAAVAPSEVPDAARARSAASVLPSLTPQSTQQLTLALGKADARLLEELRDGLRDLLSLCKEA